MKITLTRLNNNALTVRGTYSGKNWASLKKLCADFAEEHRAVLCYGNRNMSQGVTCKVSDGESETLIYLDDLRSMIENKHRCAIPQNIAEWRELMA